MTNLIEVQVGEKLIDENGYEWIVIKAKLGGIYQFMSYSTGQIEELTWDAFKDLHHTIRRAGKLPGLDFSESDDWMCHDERCYPSVLAGGCSGCLYSKLNQTRKKYFEPGDIVWVPSKKYKRIITNAALFFTDNNNNIEGMMLPTLYDYIYGFGAPENCVWSVQFKAVGGGAVTQFYRWDEIRLIKRRRHFINIPQLEHICNDLCLFGPGSETCLGCKTGKIKKQLYDIRGNYS